MSTTTVGAPNYIVFPAGFTQGVIGRSDFSSPLCALVVCPAYAVFRGLKQSRE